MGLGDTARGPGPSRFPVCRSGPGRERWALAFLLCSAMGPTCWFRQTTSPVTDEAGCAPLFVTRRAYTRYR